MKIKNITAIIISGGKSSRIGTDKALLKIGDKKIIEIIFELLDRIFENIIVIANEKDNYRFLGTDIFHDIFPGFGPLSGIHTGLFHSKTDSNFIISADMPLINEELIRYIIDYESGSDILIPTSGDDYHTLCGIYRRKCLNPAEKLLRSASAKHGIKNGKTSIKLFDLINGMKTEYLDIAGKSFYSSNMMFNMNTLEDYEYVKSVFNIKK